MSKHPEVLWAQRSSENVKEKNVVFVTINLPDIVESSLQCELKPTSISFTAQAGAGQALSTFELSIDLYKEIIPEESVQRLTSRALVINLRKKDVELEYWPRLTKEKVKSSYIKTDFSKWVDEDEQETTETSLDDDNDFGGMGGMGGMPGMGGMGGMGGMPGMGGMGGMGGFGGAGGAGGIDFEKMMAEMKNSNPDGGDAGDPEEESDTESDQAPPPLEAA